MNSPINLKTSWFADADNYKSCIHGMQCVKEKPHEYPQIELLLGGKNWDCVLKSNVQTSMLPVRLIGNAW